MRRFLLLFIAVNVLLLDGNTALGQGAKKGEIPFEKRVANADFVAIVECETAGVIVAKYRVIESCRGAKAGEMIHIRKPTKSDFRSVASFTTCGNRYFVTASRIPAGLTYSRPNEYLPYSWRLIRFTKNGASPNC